jgi:hypothetical protein
MLRETKQKMDEIDKQITQMIAYRDLLTREKTRLEDSLKTQGHSLMHSITNALREIQESDCLLNSCGILQGSAITFEMTVAEICKIQEILKELNRILDGE